MMLHCKLPLIGRTLSRFVSRSFSRSFSRSLSRSLPICALALAAWMATALPAHAQRTVTATGLGNGGFAVTPVDSVHTCANGDMGADACAGAFSYGEDSAAVDSIVSAYRSAHPSNVWGTATVETSIGGASSTTGVFDYGGSLFGGLRFQQELRGHFVVALSGRWASTSIGGGAYLREPFSAYYLFDDVVAEAFSVAAPNYLRWDLSEGPAPDVTPGVLDFYGMRGLTVDRVSIYLYAPATIGNGVPEPGSLALAGLALVAAAFAGVTRRRHRASV